MTINKSQGQTFTKVGVSLLQEVFAHGQLYVAFSRVKSQGQLFVLLKPQKTATTNVVYTQIFQYYT
jgi:ATP-dependent exoDNAse (exonuclease V) alpha subunit